MMSKNHLVLQPIEPLAGQRLRLGYADGQTFEVDLSDLIRAKAFWLPWPVPRAVWLACVG